MSNAKQSLQTLKTKLSSQSKQKLLKELLVNQDEMGDEEFEGNVGRLVDVDSNKDIRREWIDFWIVATTKARRQFLKQFMK